MPIFGSNGRPGRITSPVGVGVPVDVHLDAITGVSRGGEYSRTTTGLERGAALTVHRQRVPEEARLDIVASDVEPFAGAILLGLWEPDHAKKTLARIVAAQAADTELRIWDGEGFLRTPAGSKVWVLDAYSYTLEGAEVGVLRASLTFGESPRFATQFTSALDNVSADLADITADSAERGRQSTAAAGADQAAEIGASVYP
jgi:hypothetical protein